MKIIDKMKALANIRESHGIKQEVIAQKMGHDPSYISKIERGKQPCTESVVNKYKKALGAPDLPLTEEEVAAFKQKLYEWKDSFYYNDTAQAQKVQPQLQRCAEFIPLTHIKNLYYIFSAMYYKTIGDIELMEQTMAMLQTLEHAFDNEHTYWYKRKLGVQAMFAYKYKTAVDALLEVERLGEPFKSSHEGLYFHIGHCFTEMGYATKAIIYFEKSQKIASENMNHTFDIPRRYFIAENYSSTGQHQEALDILNSCLRDELIKVTSNRKISPIYRRIAVTYLNMGSYENALRNIDKSLEYGDFNIDAHEINLYYKSVILCAYNKIDEAILYLNECISMAEEGTLHNILYNTLFHSLSLDSATSICFITNIAIPALYAHGKYLSLYDVYTKLSNFYEKNNKKKSLKYLKSAVNISESLRKGAWI
ncbi:MAG: helix-turn-helix domain-containing protein [Defluviitaleaceae bacterium]|nr:helix-turn-helix domain-containing protein [Defluviitaleaceae bacterium]MCL2275116.1 helix-turn-helix domain-containing protein [Defluviitaleaceae bacterium]